LSITEGTQPASLTWTGAWTTAQTTASFTPDANSLLVALVAGDGANTGNITAAVSDSINGTTGWVLLKRQNTSIPNAGGVGGTCEVWCHDIGGSPASMTVSVAGSGAAMSTGGQLTIRTLLGAANVAGQTGATGGASIAQPAAAIQISVAAGTGGKIYGAAFNYDNSTVMTVLGNTTAITQTSDSTNGDTWETFKSTGDTAGTATYGFSTSHVGMIAAVEIKAAAVVASGGVQSAQPGQTWKRRFHHRQQFPSPAAAVAADATFTGVAAALVFAAPAGSVSVGLPGVTAAVVFAAPTGAVSVSINGPTATVVLAAPAGTVSATLPGVTAALTFAAPAGGFSTLTNFSANGVTATLVLAAPSGAIAVTLPGATATVVLAAPAGKVSVTLPGVTGTVVYAAPAGSVSVTLPGVTATVVFAAPVGSFTTGAGFNAAGVTATVVYAAPAGRVSVTLPGATAGVVFAANPGGFAVPFAALGVTARLVLAAATGGFVAGQLGAPVVVTGSDRASTVVAATDTTTTTIAAGDLPSSTASGADRSTSTVTGSDRPTSTVT
jgi:hypothetical protein